MSGAYRLQRLLEVRTRAREAAERALAQAVGALAREREVLGQLEARVARLTAERRERAADTQRRALAGGADAGGLAREAALGARQRAELAQLAEAVARQRGRVGEAEGLVEAGRAGLVEAARAVRALEDHRAAWAAGVRKERDRRAEAEQDDRVWRR